MKTTCIGPNLIWLFFLIPFYKTDLLAADFSFFLECPSSVTIQCTDDVSNLDKYGIAYIWKNNSKTPAPPPVKIIYNTNSCGIGTITRYWEVMDPYMKLQKCEQVITVVASVYFNLSDISWPPAYTIEGCNPATDPRNLPAPYDYPTYTKLKCSQPMHSYRDQKFTVSDGCMKIVRDWTVIDWCQFQPNVNPTPGRWTYTQVIKLILTDTTARLICPKDTIVDALKDCKGTFVKLDSAKATNKCGFPMLIRNTSPYSKSKGPDASGDYPLGTTEFYFITEYGCGKELKCKVKVNVRNKIGPVPYCLNGLIVALMPVDTNKDGTPDDGMIAVWAKDFNVGSYHPCGYKNLKFSFSSDTSDMSRVFTCADLGKNDIQMWVTDSLGNQSYCKTYLEVQNNNAKIPDCKRRDSIKSGIVLGGTVSDLQHKMVQEVQFTLYGPSTVITVTTTDTILKIRYDTITSKSGFKFYVRYVDTSYQTRNHTVHNQWVKTCKSDLNGKYSFEKLILNDSYQLKADKTEYDFQGININDVIVLLKHITGSSKITDPYKLIAADVNCDGVIDQADFELLYGLILKTRSYSEFCRHWRIIPKGFKFTDPLNPFLDSFEPLMEFKNMTQSKVNMDYLAVRVGELDGNISGFNSTVTDIRINELFELNKSGFVLENVYPNPAEGPIVHFAITCFQSNLLILSIYDVQGNLLQNNSRSFDKGNHIWEVPMNSLSNSGMFFYSISDGTQNQYGKLIRSK
jgi:hypothetical protein